MWKDIKSAPCCKESGGVKQARILVTRKCINARPPVMAAFLTVKGWYWATGRILPFEPTHWKSLPKPPGYYRFIMKRFISRLNSQPPEKL